MELKFYRNAENICAQCRSNRTFMELKFAVCRYSDNIIGSSNRTFMELKFQSSNRLALSLLVLIVPLWN